MFCRIPTLLLLFWGPLTWLLSSLMMRQSSPLAGKDYPSSLFTFSSMGLEVRLLVVGRRRPNTYSGCRNGRKPGKNKTRETRTKKFADFIPANIGPASTEAAGNNGQLWDHFCEIARRELREASCTQLILNCGILGEIYYILSIWKDHQEDGLVWVMGFFLLRLKMMNWTHWTQPP